MATLFKIFTTDPVPGSYAGDGSIESQQGFIDGVSHYDLDPENHGIKFTITGLEPGFIDRDRVMFIMPYEIIT